MAKKPKQKRRWLDPDQKLRRTIITPEGVELSVTLAGSGDRAGAVLIDLVGITLLIIAVVVSGLYVMAQFQTIRWILPIFLLLFFAVRSFYFIFFELRWQGRTPGKRLLGLRVIDQRGGPLTPDAIFARNLLRELELFLPLSLLFVGTESHVDGWIKLLALIWACLFLFLPVFNKDNLRAGDMVGGTWVVRMPKSRLLRDLTEAEAPSPATKAAQRAGTPEAPSPYVFTEAQLSIYGIYELQTLEEVLRRKGPKAGATRGSVARKVRDKIAWQPPPGQRIEARPFLEAFYVALRAHLEKRMLLGDRREDKHHEKAPARKKG